jgi:DNA-binding CsgD family transcriptional regulator
MAKQRDVRISTMHLAGEEYVVISLPGGDDVLAAVLTKAEREVARMLVLGDTNAEIARRRGSSVHTVANQVASIFRKLGVSTRAELVARLNGRS